MTLTKPNWKVLTHWEFVGVEADTQKHKYQLSDHVNRGL